MNAASTLAQNVETSSPIAFTIDDAVKASGIGRTMLFNYIKEGKLPARKSGRRTLVLRRDLEALVVSLPARGAGDE